jgi:hypothetical protein
MKMTAFWDIAPCILVEVDRRFRDVCCHHHQSDDGGGTRYCYFIITKLIFVNGLTI